MRKIKLLFLASFLTFSFLSGADKIQQPGGPEGNFGRNIIAKAYDRFTGTFYVATDRSNGNHTIAKANRNTIPATGFTGLSIEGNRFNAEGHHVPGNKQDGRINNGLFGVIAGSGVANPIVVAMDLLDNTVNDDEKVFTFFEKTPATVNETERLLLSGGGNITAAGNGTTLRLATGVQRDAGVAQRGKVFVRVYPVAGDGNANSGVCSLNVDLTTAVITGAPATLRAIRLSRHTVVLGANTGDGGILPIAQVEDMYWDDELQRLFVALNVASNNAGADSLALGIVKSRLNDADGTLQNFERPLDNLPEANEDPGVNTRTDKIFIIRQDAGYGDGNAPVVRINKIRTMKTSTGIKYLIANGGAGRITNEHVGNLVWALRLGANGNIVQNDNGDALPAGWITNNLGATQVGGEAIPFDGTQNAFISDMEVVGDTVYVSFSIANRAALYDPGVWSSTAMFNNEGAIIGWTKWERVFPSRNVNREDWTDFFAVDGLCCMNKFIN
jgi:hypothetical protein